MFALVSNPFYLMCPIMFFADLFDSADKFVDEQL
jgi:hypothetical protein